MSKIDIKNKLILYFKYINILTRKKIIIMAIKIIILCYNYILKVVEINYTYTCFFIGKERKKYTKINNKLTQKSI